MAVLRANQFTTAFDFARSEAAAVREADGVVRTLAADVPRFDHDPAGIPRGLLVTPGTDVGGQDRSVFDPLMLRRLPVGDESSSGVPDAPKKIASPVEMSPASSRMPLPVRNVACSCAVPNVEPNAPEFDARRTPS